MVTKEEVDKARAAAEAAAYAAYTAYAAYDAAWDKYIKLKEEFENGSN